MLIKPEKFYDLKQLPNGKFLVIAQERNAGKVLFWREKADYYREESKKFNIENNQLKSKIIKMTKIIKWLRYYHCDNCKYAIAHPEDFSIECKRNDCYVHQWMEEISNDR